MFTTAGVGHETADFSRTVSKLMQRYHVTESWSLAAQRRLAPATIRRASLRAAHTIEI